MRRKRAVLDLLVLLTAVGIAYIGQVLGQNSLYWLIGGLVAALVVACIQWFIARSSATTAEWQDIQSLPSDRDLLFSGKLETGKSRPQIVFDEFGAPMRQVSFREIEWGSLIAHSLFLLVATTLMILAVLSVIFPNMFPMS